MTYEEFKEKVSNVILTESGNCPVMPVVQMLQGKWKLQILYELCIKSPMRFGELKKLLKPITNTALTNALKELEKDELVQKALAGLKEAGIDAPISHFAFCTNGSHFSGEAGIPCIGFGPSLESLALSGMST